MSLIDADKQSFERDNPSPNGHDQLDQGAVRANGTTSVNYFNGDTPPATTTAIKNGLLTIVQTGTTVLSVPNVTLAANAVGQDAMGATITHGLGYVPGVLAYIVGSGGNNTSIPITSFTLQASSLNNWTISSVYYYADTNQVTFYSDMLCSSTAGGTFNGFWGGTVRYYLLKETLT